MKPRIGTRPLMASTRNIEHLGWVCCWCGRIGSSYAYNDGMQECRVCGKQNYVRFREASRWVLASPATDAEGTT